jgi:hypothetical protein
MRAQKQHDRDLSKLRLHDKITDLNQKRLPEMKMPKDQERKLDTSPLPIFYGGTKRAKDKGPKNA